MAKLTKKQKSLSESLDPNKLYGVDEVIKAIKEIFQIAPVGLDRRIRSFMENLTKERGFVTYSSYVARIGRARFIERYIVLPKDYPLDGVGTLDAIRSEIGEYIGEAGPQRWLTIMFTGDESII